MVISYSVTSFRANTGIEQLLFSLNPLVLWISPHHWVCCFYFYTFHLALNLLLPVFQCWCSALWNKEQQDGRNSICARACAHTHTRTHTRNSWKEAMLIIKLKKSHRWKSKFAASGPSAGQAIISGFSEYFYWGRLDQFFFFNFWPFKNISTCTSISKTQYFYTETISWLPIAKAFPCLKYLPLLILLKLAHGFKD